MRSFKQFLTESDDLDFLIKMIDAVVDKRPRLRIDLEYDGTDYYGFVEDVRRNNDWSAYLDLKIWSESENTYVPSTLAIYAEDAEDFVIQKDVEGNPILLLRP